MEPSPSLIEHALHVTGDAALAAELAREAVEQAQDDAERRQLITRLAEERRRAAAAKRIEAWKAVKPRAVLVAVPIAVAFAVGLAGGFGASLVEVPLEPSALVPGAPLLRTSFGNDPTVVWRHNESKELTFELGPDPVAVIVHSDAFGPVMMLMNDEPVPGESIGRHPPTESIVAPDLLKAGKNVLKFMRWQGETWSVANLRLELVPLPSKERAVLLNTAAERVGFAALLADSEATAAKFRTWKLLREAKVMIESAPGARPKLYSEVKQELGYAKTRMDEHCNELLAAAKEQPLVLDVIEDEFPDPLSDCRLSAVTSSSSGP